MIAALRFSENQRFDEHKRGTIRTQSRTTNIIFYYVSNSL